MGPCGRWRGLVSSWLRAGMAPRPTESWLVLLRSCCGIGHHGLDTRGCGLAGRPGGGWDGWPGSCDSPPPPPTTLRGSQQQERAGSDRRCGGPSTGSLRVCPPPPTRVRRCSLKHQGAPCRTHWVQVHSDPGADTGAWSEEREVRGPQFTGPCFGSLWCLRNESRGRLQKARPGDREQRPQTWSPAGYLPSPDSRSCAPPPPLPPYPRPFSVKV